MQYFNGEFVERDYVRSYAWIKLAADAGLADAQKSLGVLTQYLTEEDIEQGGALAQTFTEPAVTAVNQDVPAPAPSAEAASQQVEAAQPVPVPEAKPELTPVATANPAPPAPKPVVEPAAPAAAMGGSYQVQIAALKSQADAEDYWTRASGNRPELLDGVAHSIVRADLGEKGIYYRVRVGAYNDKSSAQTMCNNLKESGLSCFVVPAS